MGKISRVSVLTGAGVSTDSGIPDYRGPNGVWTRDPSRVDVFRYHNFVADAEVRARFWATYRDHAAWTAEPNAAHRALVDLERSGVALRVLTQNIDGLHQKAGSSPRKVLELHGSMHWTVCLACHVRIPTAEVFAASTYDCQYCGGVLKLDVVLFGEYLDASTVAQAEKIAAASELLIAVGTSLQVEPVASLCATAVNAGARLVIVNRDPTPYDDLADEVIREPIGVALPRLVDALAG